MNGQQMQLLLVNLETLKKGILISIMQNGGLFEDTVEKYETLEDCIAANDEFDEANKMQERPEVVTAEQKENNDLQQNAIADDMADGPDKVDDTEKPITEGGYNPDVKGPDDVDNIANKASTADADKMGNREKADLAGPMDDRLSKGPIDDATGGNGEDNAVDKD